MSHSIRFLRRLLADSWARLIDGAGDPDERDEDARIHLDASRWLTDAADAPTPDDGAQLRAASLAAQLGTAERALADAQRRATAATSRFNVLAGLVCAIAKGCETFASDAAGLPADVAAALATLAARIDPQPAGGAVGVGVGVSAADLEGWRGRLLAAMRGPAVSAAAGRSVLDVAGEMRRAAEATIARQPDRSTDEGHEPRERGAQVVRVVVEEGLVTIDGDGDAVIGGVTVMRIRGEQTGGELVAHEGQEGRLVVEIVGHSASIATGAAAGKSE